MIRLPPISTVVGTKDHVPPLPVKVTLLNLLVPVNVLPLMTRPENVWLKTTVPPLLLNVAPLYQLPFTVKVVDGAVTVPELTLNVLPISAELAPKDQAADEPPRKTRE
jgi:hypothetical protein